jgi:hypothetical protein
MAARMRLRFWIEAGLAVLTAVMFVVTLISPEWIEEVFGVEPDAGSGTLEWALVIALGLATVGFAVLARFEWKRQSAVTG